MSADPDRAVLRTKLSLAVIAFLVAAFVFAMAIDFRSMLDGDAMFYFPQVVQYARGGGLCNVYFERTLEYSPAHDGRHIWHGFLYQLLLGGALHTNTYPKLALACASLSAAWVLLLASVLADLSNGLPPWIRLCMSAAILLALGGFLLGLTGRPDALIFGLASAAVWVARTRSRFLEAAGLGAIVGFSGITSPLPGLFLGLAVAIWWIVVYEFSRELWRQAAVGVVAALAAVAIGFAVYPYTLHEWIHGVLEQRAVLHKFAIWHGWRSWLIYSGRFFVAGVVALGFVSAVALVLRHTRGRNVERVASLGLTLLTMFGLVYYSEVSGWYVIVGITPILTAIVLLFTAECWRREKRIEPWVLPTIVLLVFGLSALDPILLGIARSTGWNSMPLTQARQQFRQDLNDSNGGIAFSKSLFVLTEQTQGNEVLPYENYAMDTTIHSARQWAVIQEWGERWNKPPIFPGYELVLDRFSSCAKAHGRLAQWFQPTGFGYAIYKRKPPNQQAPR